MQTEKAPTFDTVFLSLGSNIGDRRQNIYTALAEISALLNCVEIEVSPIYETEAWGRTDQPDFLNCVAKLLFRHKTVSGSQSDSNCYEQILLEIKHIEQLCGRDATSEKWSARVIDIDILLYNEAAYKSAELVIPHIRMHERKFVLVPLADLAPGLIVPRSECTVKTLLADCKDESRVSLYLDKSRPQPARLGLNMNS